ncbi:unnamed protein product [Schistosoma intercalatum]|nr:unnamed protein product [Schistosoma intercalatum]CAH8495138.1 unnamed protein product [Schistosoma intercalatum]CAH8497624.1 unnamed protein product [Schistosoma bovis]
MDLLNGKCLSKMLKSNGTTEIADCDNIFLNHNEFRQYGTKMIQYVADYLETIDKRKVFPKIHPGYLAKLIPNEAPNESESWEDIMKDVEKLIMPGVTHWQHPHFHAYFPCGCSYTSICADILADGISSIGFTWVSNPACTELEVVMIDWMAKTLGLPEHFLFGENTGGVIQGSCSESTLVALLAARNKAITQYQNIHPNVNNYDALSKLVGYYSDQAHSSVERAGLIGMLQLRAIKSNEHYEMDTTILEQTIKDDVNNGLIPFFCCATLGTTATCGFDKLKDIGPICDKYNIWLHVDAAYAGSSFICPEYRYLMDGIEYATSFVFNPHKWLLINFDCSIVWYREVNWVKNSFHVDPPYLKHKHQQTTIDFRHMHIPLGRKFRSLKIWFTLRRYGVKNLQKYIRNHIQLAHYFEKLIQADDRFEIVADVLMGLVCFRIKDNNELTKQLYHNIESDGRIHLVSSELHSPAPLYFIRFAICYHSPNKQHIEYAYQVIHELCNQLLDQQSNPIPNQQINHENINLLLLDHENHN